MLQKSIYHHSKTKQTFVIWYLVGFYKNQTSFILYLSPSLEIKVSPHRDPKELGFQCISYSVETILFLKSTISHWITTFHWKLHFHTCDKWRLILHVFFYIIIPTTLALNFLSLSLFFWGLTLHSSLHNWVDMDAVYNLKFHYCLQSS